MLSHPTLERLHALGLHGAAKGFAQLAESPDAQALSHGEWLALILEEEATLRLDKRMKERLRYARLRHAACPEDIDWRASRGLDRTLFAQLVAGGWIDQAENLILMGPTGVGKSWLACALGHAACRDGRQVLYRRTSKLFADLAIGRQDGRYPRLMRPLVSAKLLILDDFGLDPLGADARHDLLEILEERHGRVSTLVTAQLPTDRWHEIIGDPTYADAILDRLVHNAHKITLSGDSLRRKRSA